MTISFVDDLDIQSYTYATRDHSIIDKTAVSMKDAPGSYIEKDGEYYGYTVAKNEPVSAIYDMDVFTIRFYFTKIDTLHDKCQEEIIGRLLADLMNHMENNKGYYNVRIPTNIVDLVKAFGKVSSKGMFCGGNVELSSRIQRPNVAPKDGIVSFFADEGYVLKHKDDLLEIALESFSNYQGHYHISPVTCDKAGHIYERWIAKSFDNYAENTIFITEHDGELAGFCTIEESIIINGLLTAVGSKHRGKGIYKRLIATVINHACDMGKAFASSTQFDNYISQTTWISLGMMPIFSYYNYHFDMR